MGLEFYKDVAPTALWKSGRFGEKLATVGEQIIATAQVSGNFPGSPTQLRYSFTLKNSKIAALTISP